jgi:carbon starvation protein CstA
MSSNDPGHGNSVASWTTVTIIMVAFALGTWFFWVNDAKLVWASAVLVPVALIVGWILKKAGYGVGGSKTKSH